MCHAGHGRKRQPGVDCARSQRRHPGCDSPPLPSCWPRQPSQPPQARRMRPCARPTRATTSPCAKRWCAMRDGVKLYTLILTPKNAKSPLPILLRAHALRREQEARQPGHEPAGRDPGPGVLREQRLRGGRSRTSAGGSSRKATTSCTARRSGLSTRRHVDESTDAWDTIDWLVKNVPANNGKVGLWGTSYPGWLTLAALRDPHPGPGRRRALQPRGRRVEGGRLVPLGRLSRGLRLRLHPRHGVAQGTVRRLSLRELRPLPLGALAREPEPRASRSGSTRGTDMWARLDRVPGLRPVLEVGRRRPLVPAAPKRMVPTLHVHGFFDQEDIYGSPAVYAALEAARQGQRLELLRGRSLVPRPALGRRQPPRVDRLRRGHREAVPRGRARRRSCASTSTATRSRPRRPATVFETGPNRWRRFDRWPPSTETRRLYLQPGGRPRLQLRRRPASLDRVCLGPGQARALRAAAALGLQLREPRRGRGLAAVAGRGPALRGRPSRRGDLDERAAHRAPDDPRPRGRRASSPRPRAPTRTGWSSSSTSSRTRTRSGWR